ncbi:nascent polypeptide-associated complex protein [Candidatus Woesearchaeota archaeon]|nr:nascent polypeptide-associated complex protein [Candidatus Woesearchaeota archaeon]
MINPHDLQKAMKRFGVQQIEVPAKKVIIQCDDKELIFDKPAVSKVSMMGQESWQVIGQCTESRLNTKQEISEEDVNTVVSQAGVTKDAARSALEKNNGDLAASILELMNGE